MYRPTGQRAACRSAFLFIPQRGTQPSDLERDPAGSPAAWVYDPQNNAFQVSIAAGQLQLVSYILDL
jgi:hypothetical protein